eukprot:jgi/Ulvmu1/6735/UM030_0070.1
MGESKLLIVRHESNCATSLCIDRPRALNALTADIINGIRTEYTKLIQSPSRRSHVVILKGSGDKAFCAGGDVKTLVRDAVAGNWQAGVEFFRAEFQLDYLISRLASSSPSIIQVALMDGIVMGGGAGLCMPGPFRVATERTIFSMPECGIGLFPDVGASYFLQRLPPGLGLLLALSGFRLKGPELLWAGLATHFIHSHKLPELEAALASPAGHSAARSAPASRAGAQASDDHVDLPKLNILLNSFQAEVVWHGCNTWTPQTSPGAQHSTQHAAQHDAEQRFRDILAIAERHFSGCTDLRRLVDGLEEAQQASTQHAAGPAGRGGLPPAELYGEILTALQQGSPLSQRLTLRSMHHGATATLCAVLRSDFRGVSHCTRHGWDLWEGVTARLAERRPPRWRHADTAQVPGDLVDTAFGPLGFCGELDLAPVDALFQRRAIEAESKL